MALAAPSSNNRLALTPTKPINIYVPKAMTNFVVPFTPTHLLLACLLSPTAPSVAGHSQPAVHSLSLLHHHGTALAPIQPPLRSISPSVLAPVQHLSSNRDLPAGLAEAVDSDHSNRSSSLGTKPLSEMSLERSIRSNSHRNMLLEVALVAEVVEKGREDMDLKMVACR